MSWEGIESILLGTVPGVLLIGTLGSLLAMGVVWLARKLITWYADKYGPLHVARAVYPYLRAMVKAEELRDQLIEQGDTHSYRICAVEFAIRMAVSIGVSSLLLITTIFAFISLWPEHSYGLAFLVCVTLLWVNSALKNGITYLTFLPNDLKKKREYLDKKYKSFSDFERVQDQIIKAELADENQSAIKERKPEQ